MIKLYLINCQKLLNEDFFNKKLQQITDERREKCLKIKSRGNRALSLGAGLALNSALMDCGYSVNQVKNMKFVRNKYEKPFISDDCIINKTKLFYNLSHSGKYVICGIADEEIGVDIEKIRKFNLKVAERFFCENEYNYLSEIDSFKITDEFFRIWTLKESYIKAVGQGLSMGMDGFEFKIIDSKLIPELKGKKSEKWYFNEIERVDGYKISICSKCNENVEVVDISLL